MAQLRKQERERLCMFIPMLPVIRSSIALGAELGRYPRKADCRNALLSEVFLFAISGIAYKSVVLLNEFVQLLDVASGDLLGEPLFVGRGRKRRALSANIAMLERYRNTIIAHRVKLSPHDEQTVKELRAMWRDVHGLLFAVLDEVEALVSRLKAAGLHAGLPEYANEEYTISITAGDIDRLIAAANAVESLPPATGSPMWR